MQTPNLRSISLSTYGVAFLATPHNIVASHIHLLCETAVQRKTSEISYAIDQLKTEHAALQRLNHDFLHIADEYQHHCFQEMLEPKVRCLLFLVPEYQLITSRSSMIFLHVSRCFIPKLHAFVRIITEYANSAANPRLDSTLCAL